MAHRTYTTGRQENRPVYTEFICKTRMILFYHKGKGVLKMKKKRSCFIFLLVFVLLAACNAEKAPEPSDDTPSNISPPIYHAIVEYGDPDLITDNTGPLWAYIRFPIAGEATDEIILNWARGVYQSASDTVRRRIPSRPCTPFR